MIKAIELCRYSNVECVREELASLENYEGANGLLSVDDKGVGTYKEIRLKTLKNGKFVPLED